MMKTLVRPIDNLLNSFTMYRVVLYVLIALFGVSLVGSLAGIISFTPVSLIMSIVVLLAICQGFNVLISKILHAPTNVESAYITALILFFIMTPPSQSSEFMSLVLASLIAMAAKYLLAISKKHIFNPAAIAAFILGLIGNADAIWWVGTPILSITIGILGLLIVRKIRRFKLWSTFMVTALASMYFFNHGLYSSPVDFLLEAFTSWPILFFASVMLTEPITMPVTNNLRVVFGGIVGLLFGAQFHVGPIFSTPEFALIIGNIFAYFTGAKYHLQLALKSVQKLSADTYEVVFAYTGHHKPSFKPGQYLEWTVPHKKSDSRGNRRYFTIASSPTEPDFKLGIKVPQKPSSFKNSLVALHKGAELAAGQLAGDFTMPPEKDKKLLFIAGGIGITPFRSMVKYLTDKKESRDIVLVYACVDPDNFVYKDVFEKAKSIGVKTIYVVTNKDISKQKWSGLTGRITPEMLVEEVGDFKTRTAYLSGPNSMVDGYKDLLMLLGVNPLNIVTDYFPGF